MRPKGVQIERPPCMGIKSGNGVNSSQVISTFIFKSCTISNLHKHYVTKGKSLIDQCAQISRRAFDWSPRALGRQDSSGLWPSCDLGQCPQINDFLLLWNLLK